MDSSGFRSICVLLYWGRISKRYDSQYVIFRTESNDLLCVETSRYAFDHNTWRGFDHGLAMLAYTLAFGFGEVEGIKTMEIMF